MPKFLEEKCNLFLSKFTFVYLQSNRLFLMAFCCVLVYLEGFHIYCSIHFGLQFIMRVKLRLTLIVYHLHFHINIFCISKCRKIKIQYVVEKNKYWFFFLVIVTFLIYLYCLFHAVRRLNQTIVKSNLTYFTFKYLIYKSLLRYKVMNDRKLLEDYVR